MNNLSFYIGSISSAKNYLTSTVIVLAGAGVAITYYYHIRRRPRSRDAVDVLNYLNVKIVNNESDCDKEIAILLSNIGKYRALGFDCEWVTLGRARQPVALVQLSTFNGLCGLFRLNNIGTMPESLKRVLEDSTIYKVGVAPTEDASKLLHDHAVQLKAALDIRFIAELCDYHPGGLKALALSQLDIILDKHWKITCSNWDAEELSQRQINYASADAHVGIKIFVKLINEYSEEKEWSWWPLRKSRGVWNDLDKICWKYKDLFFYSRPEIKSLENKRTKDQDNGQSNAFKKRYPHATRTKPLYHNCFLEAPDGELLCTIDNKKAMWYVERHLAQVIKSEPLTVRLRFEPSGRSTGEVGRYYQLTKENKCVVCGSTNSYIRKNVVPREYRKCFPEIMKDHSSHDVVLLCSGCHQRSNTRDAALRQRLAAACDAPLSSREHYYEDAACKKIRSAARALLHQSKRHVLPEARRRELEGILLDHYTQCDQVTEELLEEAAHVEVIIENSEYESHGAKVVEHFFGSEGGLLRLEEMWRENFLETMRPEYMPELWSVRHNEERLRVKLIEGRLSEEDLKLIGPSIKLL